MSMSYNDDPHRRVWERLRNSMRIFYKLQSALDHVANNWSLMQWMIFAGIMCLIGFICMRGYGSQKNY